MISPQERKSPFADSGFADDRPANSVAQIFNETADNSPSPWGEGRVEGERYTKLQPRGKLFALGLSRWDERKRSVAVPRHSNARTVTRFGQTDAGLLCHVAAPGDGRTPAAAENCRCQNHFGMDDRGKGRLKCFKLDLGEIAMNAILHGEKQKQI